MSFPHFPILAQHHQKLEDSLQVLLKKNGTPLVLWLLFHCVFVEHFQFKSSEVHTRLPTHVLHNDHSHVSFTKQDPRQRTGDPPSKMFMQISSVVSVTN